MRDAIMEGIDQFYAHLCSQSRCFAIDGQALPVCQRCLGLYVGAAVTLLWLAASGLWRRGLPSNRVLAAHVALLLVALAGGLHWIDPGPRWRLTCGLWTGHVTVLWLVGGAVLLRGAAPRPHAAPTPDAQTAWRLRETASALAMPLVFTVVAISFHHLEWLGWTLWTSLVAAGTLGLGSAVIAAFGLLVGACLRRCPTEPRY
jgi:uncharacterized membrane protein